MVESVIGLVCSDSDLQSKGMEIEEVLVVLDVLVFVVYVGRCLVVARVVVIAISVFIRFLK